MDSFFDLFKGAFEFLNSHSLFDISLLWWFIGLAVLGLVISFLKGKKE